jgi:hypothetical protein
MKARVDREVAIRSMMEETKKIKYPLFKRWEDKQLDEDETEMERRKRHL